MRDIRGSLAAKVAAAALLVVLIGGTVLAVLGTTMVWRGFGTAETYVMDDLCPIEGGMYCALWMTTGDPSEARVQDYAHELESGYQGLLWSIYDGDPDTGTLLATNRDAYASSPLLPGQRVLVADNDGETAQGYYTVVGQLTSPLPQGGSFAFYQALYDILHPLAGGLPLLTVLLAVAAVADLVFLLSAAGHRRGTEGIVPNWQDRIPLDLYLLAGGLLFFALLTVTMETLSMVGYASTPNLSYVTAAACSAAGVILAALAVLMSLSTRVKLGKWWRNSLCYMLFRWVRRLWRRFLAGVRGLIGILPMTWRTVMLAAGVLFLQLCLSLLSFHSYANNGLFFLLLLALDGAVIAGAAWLTVQAQKIRDEGRALAEGDLEAKIDTHGMYRDLKAHAENLNAIGQGLNRAVEQRMRSERLKTELITNVSHDIKTPLTSIVNYVDLLEKEELPEKAQEYLAVLDRQSRRLKKLTEDLVEASKASTGNVAVHLSPILVNEIVHQAIGDYSEKLTAGKLEVIVNTYEGNLEAMADGRLLWRVLDNLLGNVCKYALAGTRVYVDLTARDGRVYLSIKNISRDPLNVSAQDLMERFVRGDASRHTEGSGLGLNIAKSLMDLMGGTFDLSVDGDLFKAQLSLPTSSVATPPQPEPEESRKAPSDEAPEEHPAGPLEKLRRLLLRE